MKHSIKLLAVVVILATLTGCGQAESKLVGQWQNRGNATDRIEFMSDGTAIYEFKGVSAEGTWEVLKDGRLRMKAQVFGTMSVQSSTIEWQGSDEITLTGADGKIVVYKRF